MFIIQWLINNKNDVVTNIFTGIIASCIVLLGQSFVHVIVLLIMKKFVLSKIWHIRKPKKIFVVSGDIHSSTPDITHAILSGLDAEAAHRLIATAHLLYQNAEIEHTYSSGAINFPLQYYKENLIIVGGPVNNSCSNDFLKRYSPLVSFLTEDENNYEVIFNKKKYTPGSAEDYGIIIRDANPMNIYENNKCVILIAGCDSFGGLAAAKILDYYKDETVISRRKIYNYFLKHPFKKKNFAVLIRCEILGNTVTNISIVDFKFIEKSDMLTMTDTITSLKDTLK